MQFKINYKENLYFGIMFVISIVAYASMPLYFHKISSASIIISYLLGYVLLVALAQMFLIGYIKGNGIKISQAQFPDIYEILKSHSEALQLKTVPELYLVQGNGILNAFATKFLRRNFIVLNSGILEAAYQDGIDAVSFILGHELGHIKRGHVGFLKMIFILPGKCVPLLSSAYSRACEYTCDNIGFQLAQNGGVKGMLILATGTTLYKKVYVEEIESSVMYNRNTTADIVEFFSTHPQIIKRIAVLRKLERENLTLAREAFVSPSVEFKQKENNIDIL